GVEGEKELIKHLAHAVQALELVAFHPAGILDHARHGERVVGGELRIEARPRRQQLARAGGIAEVGHGLAGEHGIVGKTALLGALDFAIPANLPARKKRPRPAQAGDLHQLSALRPQWGASFPYRTRHTRSEYPQDPP